MSKKVEIKDALESLDEALRIACETLDAYASELKRLRTENDSFRDALEQALDDCKDQYDVDDGDDGRPLPNAWMKLGNAIEEALGRGGRYGL